MCIWLSSVYILGHCLVLSVKAGKTLGLILSDLFITQRKKLRPPNWVLDHDAFSTQGSCINMQSENTDSVHCKYSKQWLSESQIMKATHLFLLWEWYIWIEIHRGFCWNSYLYNLAKILYSFCSNSFLFSVPLWVPSLFKKNLKHF